MLREIIYNGKDSELCILGLVPCGFEGKRNWGTKKEAGPEQAYRTTDLCLEIYQVNGNIIVSIFYTIIRKISIIKLIKLKMKA